MTMECPTCKAYMETRARYSFCRQCERKYPPFACSLCLKACAGLVAVCNQCGHGGHVEHISDWFSTEEECPSGCGCHCTFEDSENHDYMK